MTNQEALIFMNYDCDTLDGEIIAWRDARPQPATWGDILSEAELVNSRNQSRADIRAALRVQWDTLPAWINGPYRPLFDAANRLLDEGFDEAAYEMIDAVEPTAKITNDPATYPELGGATRAQYFAAVKAQFSAIIQSFLK